MLPSAFAVSQKGSLAGSSILAAAPESTYETCAVIVKVDEFATLPEPESARTNGDRADRSTYALSLVWAGDEAWRVGQCLLIAPTATSAMLFGRGDGNDGVRLRLGEHRPGGFTPAAPLELLTVSRTQLSISVRADALHVENRGRAPLRRNGELTTASEFMPGDTLQVGRQLLFLVGRRAVEMTPPRGYPPFAFGEPDAHGLVGESPVLWELRAKIALIAAETGHVIVYGQSGSGKELVARALHSLSPRKHRRLIARNAATLPDALVDAELFGNARNYPNPGMAERPGMIGECDRGTLFLDEIGELSQASQAHLLRALDGGEYHRLGESSSRTSDFRLIAATNRDPSCLKHDFLARFTHQILVPSLNEHAEDVPLLLRHMLGRVPTSHSAPGSERGGIDRIRELVSMSYATGARELLAAYWRASVPGTVAGTKAAPGPALASSPALSNDDIAMTAQAALDQHNGALEPSAQALGLKNRYALIRLIKKYDLVVRKRPSVTSARKRSSD
jgi:two-component system response regulator HydG